MFAKALIALLAVSVEGFAPMAPRSAVRSTSLGYTVKLVSEEEGIDETIECADDVFIVDAAEEADGRVRIGVDVDVLVAVARVECARRHAEFDEDTIGEQRRGSRARHGSLCEARHDDTVAALPATSAFKRSSISSLPMRNLR